jgi:hypothetical protein
LQGTINLYIPGVGVADVGDTTISVGGFFESLEEGDQILIIQMQDATFDTTNSLTYGSGIIQESPNGITSLGQTGMYEFNYVVSYSSDSSVLTVLNPLSYTYASDGITRSFQVILVPVCDVANLTGNIYCSPWNGFGGGIVALIAASLNMNGNNISCDGSGFRGAGYFSEPTILTPPLDVIATTNTTLAASKGEGIAGTPSLVNYFPISRSNYNTSRTYPGGDFGRGAPGNAGGGGPQSKTG